MNEPMYSIVAGRLRARITSGDLQPGTELASLAELADQWHVSEIVARQALRTLAAEGLIETQRGRRARVTERPALVRVAPHRYRRHRGMTTYAEEAERAHIQVDVERRTIQTPATPQVADRLGIETGDMVSQTDYLISMADLAVSLSRCWEPLDLTIGTDIEHPDEGLYGHMGVIDRFAQIGLHVAEIEEALTVRHPEADERERLRLVPGVWVIDIRQAFLTADRVVEAANLVFRPDRYAAFVYRMPVPGPDVLTTTPGDDLVWYMAGD